MADMRQPCRWRKTRREIRRRHWGPATHRHCWRTWPSPRSSIRQGPGKEADALQARTLADLTQTLGEQHRLTAATHAHSRPVWTSTRYRPDTRITTTAAPRPPLGPQWPIHRCLPTVPRETCPSPLAPSADAFVEGCSGTAGTDTAQWPSPGAGACDVSSPWPVSCAPESRGLLLPGVAGRFWWRPPIFVFTAGFV